ncbi:MAG TPA: SAM-dependent methyltransferase [Thermoanaerobaculia bacterium]|nr:SAM-dependent methyltransferase [Thermoanaerobaculia bacterium]
MAQPDPAIRNVSDTAAWAAHYRALESARPDALFRDPFAERLAGERGKRIAAAEQKKNRADWAWAMRTVLFDEILRQELRPSAGTDLVVNLAAGLDARPYRMDLPSTLRWVEVDLPGILDYKEELLAAETPRCRLERVRLDLADVEARRALFARLGAESRRTVVISEGLLIYLEPEQVAALGRDLASPPSFQSWIVDVVSPGLLKRMTKAVGAQLQAARAPFHFGPVEGPDFFRPHGWQPLAVRPLLTAAKRFRRLPLLLRLVAVLPDSPGNGGHRPWAAVCLLGRA